MAPRVANMVKLDGVDIFWCCLGVAVVVLALCGGLAMIVSAGA